MARRKLLVVEEEPVQLRILTAGLSAEGFDVVIARDGVQAVGMVRKELPNLVLRGQRPGAKHRAGAGRRRLLPEARGHPRVDRPHQPAAAFLGGSFSSSPLAAEALRPAGVNPLHLIRCSLVYILSEHFFSLYARSQLTRLRGRQMRVVWSVLFGFAVLLFSASAYAQASIAGFVRDTSGAVLPGVTVEASSPALIEKTRVGRQRRLRAVPHRESPPGRLHRAVPAVRVQHGIA